MMQNVKSIYFNHPSQGNSTNYYVILGPRDKAAPPTSQQINKIKIDDGVDTAFASEKIDLCVDLWEARPCIWDPE